MQVESIIERKGLQGQEVPEGIREQHSFVFDRLTEVQAKTSLVEDMPQLLGKSSARAGEASGTIECRIGL